jgi:hypothetical protein
VAGGNPFTVACPVCLVPPGKRCVRIDGNHLGELRKSTHQPRIQAAGRQLRAKETLAQLVDKLQRKVDQIDQDVHWLAAAVRNEHAVTGSGDT